MSGTIWKYFLKPEPRQEIEMPPHAKPICVGFQNGFDLFLWAEVEPDQGKTAPRTFVIIGTGHQRPSAPLRYIGSAHAEGLVWHVYEEETP